MMNRRSTTFRNSSTSSIIITKFDAPPNPIITPAPAPASAPQPLAIPQLPLCRSESSKFTIRTQGGIVGKPECDHSQQLPSEKKSQAVIDYYPFPQSPDLDDLGLGKGIMSLNHDPQHRLVQLNLPGPFTCMGCKEYGAGTRFSCKQCNFELHDFCALAPPVLKAHPLHSQHLLVFNTKPGKGLLKPTCDVCGKADKGYMFKCSACSFQLHPCCAMLSPKINFTTHPHPLIMFPATATLLGDIQCAECKRKRSGQVYRCTVCDYYLHAVCAKNMVNGLHVNGLKRLDDKSSGNKVLSVAAKLASHVVMGFMGGIVEGIGEGLGEVLTQNLAKGRCNSTKRGSHISG